MPDDATGRGAQKRLRDQDLQRCEVVGSRDLHGSRVAPADRWLVVVDPEGTPVAAVGPGRVDRSSLIVANGDLLVHAALRAHAFDDIEPETGVVVVESNGQVLGVWAGTDLARALLSAPTRDSAGAELPGYPHIPFIVRSCGYVEDGVSCSTVSTFRRKPTAMPACGNEHHFSAHPFVW